MSATRNIVVRFISVMATLLAAAVIAALVSPIHIAYASVSTCNASEMDDDDYDYSFIDWELIQSNYKWHQERHDQVNENGFSYRKSDIGRAEGIVVEEDMEHPYEPAITVDTTSEIQLACACIAAIFPLIHFTKVAIVAAIRNKKEAEAIKRAKAVRVPRPVPVKYQAVAMRVCKTQTHATPATSVRRQAVAQPQRAMVFQRQPMQQTRRYPVQQQQPHRQQVQRQQAPMRRTAPILMYA